MKEELNYSSVIIVTGMKTKMKFIINSSTNQLHQKVYSGLVISWLVIISDYYLWRKFESEPIKTNKQTSLRLGNHVT